MAITAGELFINIGLKGGDKTAQGLKKVGGTLGEIKTSSLALKAGLVAVFYEFEKLITASMNAGNNIYLFGKYTGESTDALQRWQFAGKAAGITSDEVTSSIKNVQSVMGKMLIGEGSPKGMFALMNNGFDPKKAKDTFYVMTQLSALAKKMPNNAISNEYLKSFGLSEGTIAAMRMDAFNSKVLKGAKVLTQDQIKNQHDIKSEWEKLIDKFEKFISVLTSDNALPIVKSISSAADQLFRLLNYAIEFGKELGVFEGIVKVFEALGDALGGINKEFEIYNKIKGMKPEDQEEAYKKEYLKEKKVWEDKYKKENGEDFVYKISEGLSHVYETIRGMHKDEEFSPEDLKRGYRYQTSVPFAPPAMIKASNSSSQNITIQQTMNFDNPGTEPNKVRDIHKKALNEAIQHSGRQLTPAWGN